MPNYVASGAGQGALSGASIGTTILPGWGTLAGAAIGAGAGIIEGSQQEKKARRAKVDNYIPGAVQENRNLAGLQYSSTYYPGQAQDEARNAQVLANVVGNVQRNSKSATDVLNTAATVQGGLGANMANQISGRYQQWKQGALARLMGANNQIGGYQDRNYQQFLAKKAALQGAAIQNIAGGVNDALVAGGSAIDSHRYEKQYYIPTAGAGAGASD